MSHTGSNSKVQAGQMSPCPPHDNLSSQQLQRCRCVAVQHLWHSWVVQQQLLPGWELGVQHASASQCDCGCHLWLLGRTAGMQNEERHVTQLTTFLLSNLWRFKLPLCLDRPISGKNPISCAWGNPSFQLKASPSWSRNMLMFWAHLLIVWYIKLEKITCTACSWLLSLDWGVGFHCLLCGHWEQQATPVADPRCAECRWGTPLLTS